MDWEFLWRAARREFVLGEKSVHGPNHWRSVEANGLALCAQNGADEIVVRCFAIFHDCKRHDDGTDSHHGRRAAQFLKEQRAALFGAALEDEKFALLVEAVAYHADGTVTENLTVGTCWDADRLDLGRVGVAPLAKWMSTQAGKTEARLFF